MPVRVLSLPAFHGTGANSMGRARRPGFRSQLFHLLAVRPRASHLALPGLVSPLVK